MLQVLEKNLHILIHVLTQRKAADDHIYVTRTRLSLALVIEK